MHFVEIWNVVRLVLYIDCSVQDIQAGALGSRPRIELNPPLLHPPVCVCVCVCVCVWKSPFFLVQWACTGTRFTCFAHATLLFVNGDMYWPRRSMARLNQMGKLLLFFTFSLTASLLLLFVNLVGCIFFVVMLFVTKLSLGIVMFCLEDSRCLKLTVTFCI